MKSLSEEVNRFDIIKPFVVTFFLSQEYYYFFREEEEYVFGLVVGRGKGGLCMGRGW